jgi:shikimate 5-dehydrogenase
MLKLGITGYPLKTTDSPKIHKGFLKKRGLEGSYSKFPFNPAQGKKAFFKFLESLKCEGVIGLNVTVPLKEWAFEFTRSTHASKFGKAAKAVRASNTLLLASGKCANTDTQGFWDDLQAWLSGKIPKTGKFDLRIVGTGGTARGVVAGISCEHPFAKRCASVQVWGRNPGKRAEILRLARKPSPRKQTETCIVVWTLPPLSKREARKIWYSLELVVGKTFLYDVNYGARAKSTQKLLPSSYRKSGEGMLKRQAAYSFSLWLGQV